MERGNNDTEKRPDVLSWNDYFMALALVARKRSKDPNLQVGACLVNPDKQILGIGYNGFPNGCSDDKFSWGKGEGINNKHLYVCHAELNAICHSTVADLKGCEMYVTLAPCCECAKVIIQRGIKRVVYLSDEKKDKIEFQASNIMFYDARVDYRQFRPDRKQIDINLTPPVGPSSVQSDTDNQN